MARDFTGRRNVSRIRSDRIPVWIGVNIEDTSIAASTGVLVASLNAAALAFRPFTVMRTRLVVQWETDQSIALESLIPKPSAIPIPKPSIDSILYIKP